MTDKPQSITQRLSRIQKALKAPKETNKGVSYKSRSAEQILEAAKECLDDGEFITCTDDIQFIGARYYVKATATFGFDKEHISCNGWAQEDVGSSPIKGAQLTGACSSYARKYSLGGLFALDDSKDDPDKQPEQPKQKAQIVDSNAPNWKSIQMAICNDMEMCKSMTELDALMERADKDIQAMPDDFASFISDKYDGLKSGGFPDKPKVKFASVKDALNGWERMNQKILTFTTLPELRDWVITITPYLDELDRVLTAKMYLNDKNQTPRQELEANVEFHCKTILATQG